MRFLANENFPGDAIEELRSSGHDVVWIRSAAPGSADAEVLAWAMREERVLLTFDSGTPLVTGNVIGSPRIERTARNPNAYASSASAEKPA
jgi:predicted nuclease of predicted toxin-antitoxin system